MGRTTTSEPPDAASSSASKSQPSVQAAPPTRASRPGFPVPLIRATWSYRATLARPGRGSRRRCGARRKGSPVGVSCSAEGDVVEVLLAPVVVRARRAAAGVRGFEGVDEGAVVADGHEVPGHALSIRADRHRSTRGRGCWSARRGRAGWPGRRPAWPDRAWPARRRKVAGIWSTSFARQPERAEQGPALGVDLQRRCRRCSRGWCATGRPARAPGRSNRAPRCPERHRARRSASWTPARQRSRLDLPAPLRPMTTTRSPRPTRSDVEQDVASP